MGGYSSLFIRQFGGAKMAARVANSGCAWAPPFSRSHGQKGKRIANMGESKSRRASERTSSSYTTRTSLLRCVKKPSSNSSTRTIETPVTGTVHTNKCGSRGCLYCARNKGLLRAGFPLSLARK